MKRISVRLFQTLAVLVLAVAAVSAVLEIVGSVQLRREYDALQSAGRPLRSDQIIPPPIAEADNGAALVMAAHSLLAAAHIGTNQASDVLKTVPERIRNGELDGVTEKQVADFLESPALLRIRGLLQEGVDRKACRFASDWTQGPQVLLPQLSAVRSLSRVLAAEALVEARQGRQEDAWRTLQLGMRTADIPRDEPTLISQLVRYAQYLTAADAIRATAALVPPTEEQAQALVPLVLALDPGSSAAFGFDGERLLVFEWIRQRPLGELLSVIRTMSVRAPRLAGWLWLPVRRIDQAYYLRLMGRLAETLAQSPREWVLMAQEEREPRIPWYCVTTGMLAPALPQVWKRAALALADRAVTHAGLMLCVHKARHGAYPDTLDGLDADLKSIPGLDPLTGRPLLYHRDGDGFVLYSVGENLKDDGGSTVKMSKESSTTLDIVWRMPR